MKSGWLQWLELHIEWRTKETDGTYRVLVGNIAERARLLNRRNDEQR
jgi:hypothetical protein